MKSLFLAAAASAVALSAPTFAQTTGSAPAAQATPDDLDQATPEMAPPSAGTNDVGVAPAEPAEDAVTDSTTTTTGTTTTDAATSTDASASSGAVTTASAADVTAGAKVMDPDGGMVGTIEKVDANGAVIATGKARVQIPIASFAKNEDGLVISLTKAELEGQAGTPSA
jgi:hypothetical protein